MSLGSGHFRFFGSERDLPPSPEGPPPLSTSPGLSTRRRPVDPTPHPCDLLPYPSRLRTHFVCAGWGGRSRVGVEQGREGEGGEGAEWEQARGRLPVERERNG